MDFTHLLPKLKALSVSSSVVKLANSISFKIHHTPTTPTEFNVVVQSTVLHNLTFLTPLALSRFMRVYNLISFEYFSKVSQCQELEREAVRSLSLSDVEHFANKVIVSYIASVYSRNNYNYLQEVLKEIRRGAEIIIYSPCNNTPTSFRLPILKRPKNAEDEANRRMKIMWEEKIRTGDPNQCYVTEIEKLELMEEFDIPIKTITISSIIYFIQNSL